MKRKTAIYCRSALYDEIAVARQEAQCREYAHALGIDDADIAVYRDCGASGATLGRPAMSALTEDVTAGNVGAVIASDMARIARSFTLMSEWREPLRAYGVKLFTLADGEIGNGLTYSLVGDYHLPSLALSDPPDAPPLGYYGLRHKAYLREEKPALYAQLLLSERLYPLCREIDEAAANRRALGMSESEIIRELICC
jgi:hypothetical protein